MTNQRIPFDLNEPLRYLIALIAQALAALCILYCVAPVIAFMIGSCWMFLSLKISRVE